MNFPRSSLGCLRIRNAYNLFVPHNQAALQRIVLLGKQFGPLIKQIVQISRKRGKFFSTQQSTPCTTAELRLVRKLLER